MRLTNKGISNANFMPRSSVIYGVGTAWFETQSLSGNLDRKIVLFHSKNHFRCTHMHEHVHTHTRTHTLLCTGLFFFLCSDFIMRGGGDCASLPSDWALIFIQVDMSSDVKSLTNKPAAEFCRGRHKGIGVSSQSIPNGGPSVSMGTLGHTNAGEFIFEAWRSTQHMDSIKTPPPPF